MAATNHNEKKVDSKLTFEQQRILAYLAAEGIAWCEGCSFGVGRSTSK